MKNSLFRKNHSVLDRTNIAYCTGTAEPTLLHKNLHPMIEKFAITGYWNLWQRGTRGDPETRFLKMGLEMFCNDVLRFFGG